MTAMFKRADSVVQKAFAADNVKMFFGSGISAVLVQGFNFTFQQQVNRLYELDNLGNGKSRVYYVAGRSQGQASLNRVIGPDSTIKALYETFGDVCQACSNAIMFDVLPSAGECCASSNIRYLLQFCVLTQVGVSVQAQDMVINEQSQLMFSGCQVY